MRLYHGSIVGGLNVLKPRVADYDRPYVYLSESDVVASFYIANPVERPYYWFPYGFSAEKIPVYHELYQDALRGVAEGHSGYLYQVEVNPSQIIPPARRRGSSP